jgi:uncharacterized membrane protein YhaH (DUF805 family)
MNPIFSNLLLTLKSWNDYKGKSTREEYIHFLIFALPLYYFIIPMLDRSGNGLSLLLSGVLLIFFLPLQVRRYNDLGMNTLLVLLIFIPWIGLIITLVVSLVMNPQLNPSTPEMVKEEGRSQQNTSMDTSVNNASKAPQILLLLLICAGIGFSPLLVGLLGKLVFPCGGHDCFWDVLHWFAIFTLPFAALAFIVISIIIMTGVFRK